MAIHQPALILLVLTRACAMMATKRMVQNVKVRFGQSLVVSSV